MSSIKEINHPILYTGDLLHPVTIKTPSVAVRKAGVGERAAGSPMAHRCPDGEGLSSFKFGSGESSTSTISQARAAAHRLSPQARIQEVKNIAFP